MADTDRRSAKRYRSVGVLAIAIGVLGAVALWFVAAKRYDDAVGSLAPAPVGCDTTLVFDRTGTYTLFVETRGSVGEIDGDCDNDDRSYDFDDEPRVELRLLDEDGEEIDLERADGPSYDRAGSAGEGIRTVQIEAEGDYVLEATSDVDDVMIRVGRDPANGVTPMRVGAVVLLAAGIVLGILAFLRGRAQWTIRPGGPGPAAVPWPPAYPSAPPIAPPYANPPTPPPYAPPPQRQPLPPPRLEPPPSP